MATQSTRDTTTVLRDHINWTTWISQLQARCVVYKIWDQIDPDATTIPTLELTVPLPLLVADYILAANILSATRALELST
jgi:hypothetical protein